MSHKPLLGLLPQFSEKIKNNQYLIQLIRDEIQYNAEFVAISSNDDYIASGDTLNWAAIENLDDVTEKVLKIIIEFINENYIQK